MHCVAAACLWVYELGPHNVAFKVTTGLLCAYVTVLSGCYMHKAVPGVQLCTVVLTRGHFYPTGCFAITMYLSVTFLRAAHSWLGQCIIFSHIRLRTLLF